MNKPGRMKDKIVTLLFVIAGVASLDYHNLLVDEISGELLKPSNWSEAKFLTVQQLRLSELLRTSGHDGEPWDERLFPAEIGSTAKKLHKRSKRSVADPAAIHTAHFDSGYYREEKILIPQLKSANTALQTNPGSFPQAKFEIDGKWMIRFEVVEKKGTKYLRARGRKQMLGETHLPLSTGSSTQVSNAVVTAMDLAALPSRQGSGKTYFLALAVSSDVAWPGAERDPTNIDIMNINEPVVIPPGAESKLFRLTITKSQVTFTPLSNVPTIQAKDVKFFKAYYEARPTLHLSFAHRGNVMLGQKNVESTLLRINRDGQTFSVTQGYAGVTGTKMDQLVPTEGRLATRNPQSLIQCEIYDKNYLVFANEEGDKASPESDQFSFVYKFNPHVGLYELDQQLLTFGARDVAYVHIPDPNNPLNSRFFLVFANHEENVDSMVFQFVSGTFVAFQSISLPSKPISVASSSKEGANNVLHQVLAFLTNMGVVEFFQFNGYKFEPSLLVNPITPTLAGSTAATKIRFNDYEPEEKTVLRVEFPDGATKDVPLEFNDVPVNEFYTPTKDVIGYLDDIKEDFPLESIDELNSKFAEMPRKSDDLIRLDSIEFSGTFEGKSVAINPWVEELSPSLKAKLSQNVEESSLTVNEITIDASLLSQIENINSETYSNNVNKLSQAHSELVRKIDVGVKTNESSSVNNDVSFANMKVEGTVKTDAIKIEKDVKVSPIIDEKSSYDLVEFMSNTVQIPNEGPVLIEDSLKFENIQIDDEYALETITSDLNEPIRVADLWHQDRRRRIRKDTTLAAKATFNGEVTVDGQVDGMTFTKEKILLTAGDQELTSAFSFQDVDITSLHADKINDFELSNLDDYLSYTEDTLDTSVVGLLEVDQLELPKINYDELSIVQKEGYEVQRSIHMKDLMTLSMKRDQTNRVRLPYALKGKVESNNFIIPENFLSLNEDSRLVSDFIFDSVKVKNADVKIGGKILTGSIAVDEEQNTTTVSDLDVPNGVLVDSNKHLEVLLTKTNDELGLTGYEYVVAATKNFPSLFSDGNITFSGKFLGEDNATFQKVLRDNSYHEDYTYDGTLELDSINDIDKIDLNNGGKLQIGKDFVDLVDVFNNGVKKNIASLPNTIKSVKFTGKLEFLYNVDVASLEDNDPSSTFIAVDPHTDFLPLTGSQTRTFQKPVTFSGSPTISESPSLTSPLTAQVTTCVLSVHDRCLCSDCSDEACERMGDECVFKAGQDDPSLYNGIKTFTWKHLEDNGLKPDGAQTLKSGIKFLAGADVDTLTVTPAKKADCSFGTGVLCENVALKNIDQTFTGTNTMSGSADVSSDISVSSTLQVTGNVAGVDISNAYKDSLLKDSSTTQVVTGKKTLTKELWIDNLVTGDSSVVSSKEESLSSCSNDFVLRTEPKATIAGKLKFKKKISASKFVGGDSVTWDGVTFKDFENNLLDNVRDQVLSKNVTFSQDVAINTGLVKSSADDAVNTINGVDIVELNTKALRISKPSGFSATVLPKLHSVKFDTFEVTDAAGISVGGTFLGVDLADDAVTKTVKTLLEMDVDHDFTGSISTSENVRKLKGNFVNSKSEEIDQDALWSFLNGDSTVKKIHISHVDGGKALNEPTITSINSRDLGDLSSQHWNKDENTDIIYPVSFDEVKVKGILNADHLDSETLSLVGWRDRYLSLSKAQTITGAYSYDGGLTVDGEVSTNYVFIGDSGLPEGLLKTETVQHKFLDHYFKVLLTNMTYPDVTTLLSPSSMTAEKDVILANTKTINGVDLGVDALTFRPNDEKTFPQHVKVTGGLKVVSANKGNLTLSSSHNVILLNKADELTSLFSVNLPNSYSDAVLHSNDDTETIVSGKVTISAAPTFTSLNLGTGKTLHSVDIGTCAAPKILLKSGSCSSDSQTVSGEINFNTDKVKKPLTLTKTVLRTGAEVNGDNFADILASLVSKSKAVDETFTKKKIFKQEVMDVDPSVKIEFDSDVFGLLADLEADKYLNMSYPSGGNNPDGSPIMPRLAQSIDKIAVNSLRLEDQFSHLTPMYTTLDQSVISKSIPIFTEHNVKNEAEFNDLPFHIATFYGDTKTGRVGILFHRMSALEGEIELESVPEDGDNLGTTIDQGLMIRDSRGNNIAFGQIIALRLADPDQTMRYVILMKSEASGFNEIRTYTHDGSALELIHILPADQIDHINHIGKACFAACGVTSQVWCYAAGVDDPSLTMELTSPNCFQSSSVTIDDGSTILATLGHQSIRTGNIDIYDVTNPRSQIANHLQTINCHMCSHTALGRYGDKIFIVVLSWTYDFVSIGEWDESAKKFKVFQSLQLPKPSEAIFFNHEEFLYLSIITGSRQDTQIKRFMFRGEMAFTEMEEMSLKLIGIQSHSIISHPLLDSPLVSSTGESNDVSTLSANTLLRSAFKQANMVDIRDAESKKPTKMVETMPTACMNILTSYVTQHYAEKGGWDKPQEYTNFMLRLMQRPLLQVDPELFSETVHRELRNLGALEFTNLPDAAALLYKYNDDGSRDLTSASFVGSVHVFGADVPGAFYTRARIIGNVVNDGNDETRKVTYWTSCEADGELVDKDLARPELEQSSVESELSHPGDTKIRDICVLTKEAEYKDMAMNHLKSHVSGTRGDDSRGAVKVYSGAKDINNKPKWVACGYLKLPEQALLHFKKLHSEDISDQVLMLDY